LLKKIGKKRDLKEVDVEDKIIYEGKPFRFYMDQELKVKKRFQDEYVPQVKIVLFGVILNRRSMMIVRLIQSFINRRFNIAKTN